MTSGAWRHWWLPVFIVTLSGLLQFGMPATSEWLRLEPDMIRDGEIWRLLSGHLLHLSWGHFLMNGVALLAVCGLFAPAPGALAWWTIASACSVGLGLLLFDPQLGWYVGLSGVVHGLLVAGGLREALRHGQPEQRAIGIALVVAVSLKLGWEQAFGPLPGSELAAGGTVIANAHLYGAFGGAAALACQRLLRYRPAGRRAMRR